MNKIDIIIIMNFLLLILSLSIITYCYKYEEITYEGDCFDDRNNKIVGSTCIIKEKPAEIVFLQIIGILGTFISLMSIIMLTFDNY